MKEPIKAEEVPMPSMVAVSNTTAHILKVGEQSTEALKESVQILMELIALNTSGWNVSSDSHIAQPTKEKNMEAMRYILELLSEGMSPEEVNTSMEVGDKEARKCSQLIDNGHFDEIVEKATSKPKVKPFMAARRVANA